MTAATLNGTAGGGYPVRGHSFAPNQTVTLEADAGLTCVVTVAPGDPIEWAPVDTNDTVTGGWTTRNAGQQFTVNEAQRVAMRPRGSSAVTLAWTGAARLAKLQAYTGRKGEDSGG